MRFLLVAAAVSVLAAAPAAAQEETPSACMAATPVTAELVAEISQHDWQGTEARGRAPAFLVGSLWYLRENQALAEGAHGSVVFVRGPSGDWRAFLPRPGESLVAAFVAPSSGGVILATQVQTEGPGQSWTLLRSSDGLAAGGCVEIAFPDALNQPNWANEHLALHDLDIRGNGRGEIVAVARVERGGAEQTWNFRYRTHDGGASWSLPSRTACLRRARAGLYEKVDDEAPAPAGLVAELAAYAAGR